jgi:hypothetical protein
MKRITNITLFVLPLGGLACLAVFGLPAVVKADNDTNTSTFDVACDCRTASQTFFTGNRGDAFIVSGKIFSCRNAPFRNRRQ